MYVCAYSSLISHNCEWNRWNEMCLGEGGGGNYPIPPHSFPCQSWVVCQCMLCRGKKKFLIFVRWRNTIGSNNIFQMDSIRSISKYRENCMRKGEKSSVINTSEFRFNVSNHFWIRLHRSELWAFIHTEHKYLMEKKWRVEMYTIQQI